MNSPATTTTKIIPKSVLRIDGDPTQWGLRDVGATKPSWTAPAQLAVEAPLVGTLVLSPRAGGVAIFPPTPGDGWMPGMRIGFTYLYLPTTSGVHSNSPFYELTGDNTVAEVAQKIADAMSANNGNGTTLTLEFSSVGQPGYVVLNAATLAFAVVGS